MLAVSSAAAIRAAIPAGRRSAMARTSTPPSVCGERPGLDDRPAGFQGGGDVEAAEQPVVGDRGGDAPHRRLRAEARRQCAASQASRTGPGPARDHDSAAVRVEREGRRRENCARCQTEVRARRLAHPRRSPSSGPLHPHRRAGIVERIAPQAVAERHRRDAPQLRVPDLVLPLEAGERARRADQRQFAAQAVRAEREAKPRRALDRRIGRRDRGQALARGDDPVAAASVSSAAHCFEEGVGVALVGVAALDDLDPARQCRAAS